MKKILIIKRKYRDYNDHLGDFVSKATEADGSWSEVSDAEYEEISKLVQDNNNAYRYSESDYDWYELIEYVDPKTLLTSLADELKLKAQQRIELERKNREKQEKRRKTLEARKIEKEKKRLEELKTKYATY